MQGVTAFTPQQLELFLASGVVIGLLCALKDLRRPGELPAMVLGALVHTALSCWYAVSWPAQLEAITQAMLLRSALLLVASFFLVGAVSVGAALCWLFFRPGPS